MLKTLRSKISAKLVKYLYVSEMYEIGFHLYFFVLKVVKFVQHVG